MHKHEHDTIDDVEAVPATVAPASNNYWDWPGTIELAPYDPAMPPEEMTNPQWAQWAYDNRSPKWAIEVGLARRTPPTLTSLEPNTAVIGDPSFTLYISGENFHAASVIMFAGQDENTTLGADGRLSTGVNMDYWHSPDTVQVTVNNGDKVSEPLDFTFTEAVPAPDPEAVAQDETSYGADPDDLEEEIEAAQDDGDFVPAKKAKAKKKR